ncbi:hypothetical protein ACWD1W_35680 [Streptomyces olivaceoviridis]
MSGEEVSDAQQQLVVGRQGGAGQGQGRHGGQEVGVVGDEGQAAVGVAYFQQGVGAVGEERVVGVGGVQGEQGQGVCADVAFPHLPPARLQPVGKEAAILRAGSWPRLRAARIFMAQPVSSPQVAWPR